MRLAAGARRQARCTACLAAALAALLLCGCSSSAKPKPQTTAVAVDCSKSVRGELASWYPEISVIASKVLSANGTLFVGCFFGARSGVQWLPPYEGDALPKLTGGAEARHSLQVAWGRSLEGVLARQLRIAHVNGTDWLSALESASKVPDVHTVYLFSDLLQEAEGVNLIHPTSEAELMMIAREWRLRLSTLRGKLIISVGGGQHLREPINERRGVQLFEDLARLVPFKESLWSI